MEKVSFSKVFGEIYIKHSKKLEMMRRKVLINYILIIFFLVLLTWCAINILKKCNILQYICCVMVAVPYIGIYLFRVNLKIYKNNFKKRVIKVLVEEQNDSYNYIPTKGINLKEYIESAFCNDWNEFHSEDYIAGNVSTNVKFRMSQVRTLKKTRNSRIETFRGVYGIIDLPCFSSGIFEMIHNSKYENLNKYKVNMESIEFEEYYDVFAEDRVLAMQILNAESIEKLIEIRRFFERPLYIRINKNKIYFRLSSDCVFDPPKLKDSIDFDLLYKYYRMIDIPKFIYDTLMENIADSIGDKEFSKEIKENKKEN